MSALLASLESIFRFLEKSLHEMKSDIDEELADTFIYLIKIANQFNVDLENEFLNKMSKNKKRFEEG